MCEGVLVFWPREETYINFLNSVHGNHSPTFFFSTKKKPTDTGEMKDQISPHTWTYSIFDEERVDVRH